MGQIYFLKLIRWKLNSEKFKYLKQKTNTKTKNKTVHAMIEVMKFKAELVSKFNVSFFTYELMHKTGKLLANIYGS